MIRSPKTLLRRRQVLAWGATVLLPIPHTAIAAPGLVVTTEQLRQWAAQRFPVGLSMRGLLDFVLQTPTLRLLQANNRLAIDMPITAAGPALHAERQGRFEVDCKLRYEASDHSVRAHQPRVQVLTLQGLRANAAALVNQHGAALAQQLLQDQVLHRLSGDDLARMDRLGMQPGAINVTTQGLAIALALKPL